MAVILGGVKLNWSYALINYFMVYELLILL